MTGVPGRSGAGPHGLTVRGGRLMAHSRRVAPATALALRAGAREVLPYPGCDLPGCLRGAEHAGVVAGPDMSSQPGGEALVLGDDRLFGGAAPGGPAAEPFGYDVIGAVQGAEADRADELAAWQGLQLAGQQ